MSLVYVLTHAWEMKNSRDEELEERAKMIGVYASEHEAAKAVERLKMKPGFCDYPDGFVIDPYELNEDGWQDGFVTVVDSGAQLTNEL